MRRATAMITAAFATAIGCAQDVGLSADELAERRLTALLRIEHLRIVDPAAWTALDRSDDAAWSARVALARRRVFEDPFDGGPSSPDAASALARGEAAGDDRDRRFRAFYDLARANAPLPKAADPFVRAGLSDPDDEIAGVAARAFAKIDGAGEAEASTLTAAFLDGRGRVARIDILRALARLPGGPARPALLAAIKGDDPHVRRTAFETLAEVGPRLEPRDREGLSKIAEVAAEVDPVVDVRAAALDAFAALDRDRFLDRLERWRLDAPAPVRAAAARRLGLFGFGAGFVVDGGFVDDPDRRVRQALYEATTAEVDRRRDEMRQLVKEPSFKLVATALLSRPGATTFPSPPTADADPIDVGLRADLVRALLDAKIELSAEAVDAFLTAAAEVVPEHETEARQFVVACAASAAKSFEGSKAARAVLVSAAASVEPGTAAPARKALLALAPDAAKAPKTPRPELPFEAYLALARRSLDPTPMIAKIVTNRGTIVVRLRPDVAPFAVDNFRALARRRFFDGILFHRVVPAFVAQAGCPRGDGFGGPGWTIPCEVSDLPYDRGTLGMALAGKDTGGSQWFLTHRRVPHLEGKYAVFGAVEEGLDVLDALVQGDRIRSIAID